MNALMSCTFFSCISSVCVPFCAHGCIPTARQLFFFFLPIPTEINWYVSKHMCISKYSQRRYINMSTPVA